MFYVIKIENHELSYLDICNGHGLWMKTAKSAKQFMEYQAKAMVESLNVQAGEFIHHYISI